jgi:hypothetical protein
VELVSQYLVSLKSIESHEDACAEMKEDFICGYIAVGKTLNHLATTSIEDLMKERELTQKQICFIDAVLNVSDDRALDREGTLKILLNIEEQMLKSDLTSKELEIPLMTVSLAKYSVKYFIEQIASKKSELKNFIDGDLAKFKWPWKADAMGALTGAGGGVIGVIGGAVGGSIAKALGLI